MRLTKLPCLRKALFLISKKKPRALLAIETFLRGQYVVEFPAAL